MCNPVCCIAVPLEEVTESSRELPEAWQRRNEIRLEQICLYHTGLLQFCIGTDYLPFTQHRLQDINLCILSLPHERQEFLNKRIYSCDSPISLLLKRDSDTANGITHKAFKDFLLYSSSLQSFLIYSLYPHFNHLSRKYASQTPAHARRLENQHIIVKNYNTRDFFFLGAILLRYLQKN